MRFNNRMKSLNHSIRNFIIKIILELQLLGAQLVVL